MKIMIPARRVLDHDVKPHVKADGQRVDLARVKMGLILLGKHASGEDSNQIGQTRGMCPLPVSWASTSAPCGHEGLPGHHRHQDEDAPVFRVADFGLVGDPFQAVPEWVAELQFSEGAR